MPPLRQERVRELIKRALSEILRREVDVQKYGMMTIHDVGLARDMHSAMVYVGILGGETQRRQGAEYLTQHRGRLQSLCGKEVNLKYTPILQFKVDDSVERGNRVMDILDQLGDPGEPAP